jgi:predicted RNase H-like HicB family nuclease
MTTYCVIYEPAPDGSWSAHAADLPVFSAGETREEVEREIQQGIRFYLDELARRGKPVPETRCVTGTVTV